MADILRSLARPEPNPNIPALRPGDTVRVHNRIVEGDRERVQIFQGTVMGLHGGGTNGTFTVRRIAAHGVGVERTFALLSPRVEKVEVLRHGRVRRAKLYYLRARRGKATRLRERREAAPQKKAAPVAQAEA
ncbi:MAG TPA: 50S ribosomal protein L19 [Anaerolineae bacterium]|nr:50S ribosomal protein L19 [Anaerolineae bacterium]HPL30284.1 50S ribosomal protein L19 [Anaerolineae bacterium]